MKTTKLLSVISLALIFAGITAGFSTKVETSNTMISTASVVTYKVIVHLTADKPICNTYWIQIINETGRLVAPAQMFVPGKSQYNFYSASKESGIRERGGKRIAMLIIDPKLRNLECENNMTANPDVKTGLFLKGQTYIFNLFPVWDLQTDKN
jgi:hypothetical protein